MADSSIGPGTLLAGRFRLEDLLDESSGALFWRATDEVLARSVAVHVLPDTDPRADALLSGARSSALVSDPRLLRVLDAAAADGMVYVVNEWGSGVSLDRLLAEGALSPRRAAWVVQEVADAIATAHRNGVAHGRLLPENVMISEAGTVKLIGFVIDAVLRSREGQRLATHGTPVTARESDVLNLAGLLYAALVCRWPGTEGSSIPVAPSEHGRPLRPRRVRAGVPRPLDAICEQVLNGDQHPGAAPIDTALEIKAALSDFLGDPAGSSAWEPSGSEPTAVLDRSTLPAGDRAADPVGGHAGGSGHDADGDADGDSDGDWVTSTGDSVTSTGAFVDPEATQAGAPMFLDDDDEEVDADAIVSANGAGTARPSWSRSTQPAPSAPDEAGKAERPLFADPGASARWDGVRPGGASATGSSAAGASTTGTYPGPAAGGPSWDGSSGGGYSGGGYSGGGYSGGGSSGGSSSGGTSGGTSSTRRPLTGSAFTGSQRSVGAGNGSVPPVWGPDADESADEDDPGLDSDSHDEDLPGRSWLRLAVVLGVVLVVVLGVVLALNLGRDPADEPTPAPESTASPSAKASVGVRVPVAGVSDFDPQGDPPEENPDLAGLAVDGKPGTFWKTVTYRGNPELGGLKTGVGLLVDLGRKVEVGDVRLLLAGDGTSVELLAAPEAVSTPSNTDGMSTVASASDAGTQVDLKLKEAVSTRWLVVWLTSLPAAPGGFQGRVAEISVRS